MQLLTFNKRQTGASLMEVLVAMSISLVVTASMIALMANTLSSTTRIIHMTKLTDSMRVALQMMGRDLRRSSYNANSMLCYSNEDCITDGSITAAGDITINEAGTCFTFLLDRDHDGDSTENDAGGFRQVTVGGVGSIEMWTGGASPDCGSAAGSPGWVQVTNPGDMDIFGFDVEDVDGNILSYTQVIQNDGFGNTLSQRVRKLRMNIQGRLIVDNTIERQMEDVINVRNDLLF
jgi:hypothetical protein